MNQNAIIGIDLGATRIKAGLVRGDSITGTVVANLQPEDRSQEGVVRRLAAVVQELISKHLPAGEMPVGIGIGSPGVIRHADGVIVKAPNFDEWNDFELGRMLSQATGLPTSLDNDANVITLGEAVYGAGRGMRDFVCLTLGSGLGGGLFLDGKIYRGADGMAGELGHIGVEPEGFPCNCGSRGCVEQYVAAVGLRNYVKRDNLFGDETEAALADPDLPKRLFEMAMAGDQDAKKYFHDVGYYMAMTIGTCLNLLNVEAVVVAGGLTRAWSAFGPTMLSELSRRAYPVLVKRTLIVKCQLWEDAGILGAAALMSPVNQHSL
jgi:glucokinase